MNIFFSFLNSKAIKIKSELIERVHNEYCDFIHGKVPILMKEISHLYEGKSESFLQYYLLVSKLQPAKLLTLQVKFSKVINRKLKLNKNKIFSIFRLENDL